MPIDPSIIGNIMIPQAPQLPDVNAMMQTRTAGMENVYKLERQRAADAQAAADAQEEASVKALIPAYSYALSNPSDLAGALELAPPEYRDSLAPYIQQLQGQPPEQVQAALIGSLSSSKYGQAFLENQARMRTAGIQERQARTAEARLAHDVAQAGKPVAMTPYQEAHMKLEREKFAAEQASKSKIASGEASPTTLQKGERWNPATQQVEAVPGSALFTKQKSAQSTDYNAAKNAVRELVKVRGTVKALKDTTGYQKSMGTGTVMANMPNVPGVSSLTGAYDFQTKYKNLKGAVATMGRAAASLQGKLGNMAVQEWKLVSDAIANLDLENMSADVLDNQLDIIANDLTALEAQVRDAYDKEWSGTQFYSPLDSQGPAGEAKTSGGSPVRPAGVGSDWTHMTDANGVGAWVSPDQKQIIEDQ